MNPLKNPLKPDWSELHERRGVSLATFMLAPLSLLYMFGIRLWAIVLKSKKKRVLPGFTVSVGNLTTGGTGKTPAVCMLAEWARDEGYKVAILSRGYGGSYREKVLEVSDGHVIKTGPAKAGDEPCLLAGNLKGVQVWVSKNRYSAGIASFEAHGTNFFILDDGFQHRKLSRDIDLVLLDASSPLGNGHLLPWGPLRESEKALIRADAFIITRADNNETESRAGRLIKNHFQGKMYFQSSHVIESLIFPLKEDHFTLEYLRGKRVLGFSGIARPDSFKNVLKELGAEVVFFKPFMDHHQFTSREMDELANYKEQRNADFLVTTEKDWFRIQGEGLDKQKELAYLKMKLKIRSEEEKLFSMIKEKCQFVFGQQRDDI